MSRHALALFALLGACGIKAPPLAIAEVDVVQSELNADAVAGVSDPALRGLLHRHWEAVMARSPRWATRLGDHRFDAQLGDPSPQAREAWEAAQRQFLADAKALDASALGERDAVTHALFVEKLERDVDEQVCGFHRWSVSPRINPYVGLSDLPMILPVDSEERAANQLSRYRQIPAVVDAEIADLRGGLAEGLVANAASVQLVVDQVGAEIDKPLEVWPLWDVVTEAHLPPDRAERFAADVTAVLSEEVRPAFERYVAFLRDEVLPEARPQGREGLGALPDGPACYEVLVRKYTTLPAATAEDRHQAGLEALRGIHGEFRELGEKVFGTDDLATIFAHLRTDEALFFQTEQQIEDKARSSLARAEAAMGDWFGRTPQRECIVERTPDHEAPYTTIAYYRQPTPEKPGRYTINTYKPATRPRHEAEVLAYHESIPGHHLQIAIAQELPELPAFRRHEGMTAFVEGWALYAERLSDEMGLYTSDTDRLGMLSFDAWRASRLVVDTGVHAKGWSREQAAAFMVENTPLAENNIRNEVDRYISWPGQALAYKTGQIEIWRLRRDAEARLGERFDIKAFHDVVLGGGAVSLPVLGERVEAWVAAQES